MGIAQGLLLRLLPTVFGCHEMPAEHKVEDGSLKPPHAASPTTDRPRIATCFGAFPDDEASDRDIVDVPTWTRVESLRFASWPVTRTTIVEATA